MSLVDTPRANRLHIALYGKRNSGKSSLINALTGQQIALVSDVAGTTTDPVYKAMELNPIGPVVFIDTAGFDDEGELGQLRVEATEETLKKADVALLVLSGDPDSQELGWAKLLREKKIPIITVYTKKDLRQGELISKLPPELSTHAVEVSSSTKEGIEELKELLIRQIPEGFEQPGITEGLVQQGDVVLLVMPQDIQAPKGRLILPQVQTIRDLLDRKCTVVSVTADQYPSVFSTLKEPPKLIITDSQCFHQVHQYKPQESQLTSFSVLFAAYKGDIKTFVAGADALDHLTEGSRVLIAEACTHAPKEEDIGRVKIPELLRKRVGSGLQVDVVAGVDFPKDVTPYDLIIHCGACMFNRRYVLSRVSQAVEQHVPITNYGIAIAKLTGILDQITY